MVALGDVAWQQAIWGDPVPLVLTMRGWEVRHATRGTDEPCQAAAGRVRGPTRQVISHAAQKGYHPMRTTLVINRNTGTLHTCPASEACNLDAANRAGHLLHVPLQPEGEAELRLARQQQAYRKDCRRCFR